MKIPIIISCVIQKGGNAKTVTAACLSAAFAKLKKRVLVIDCDPQANLTDAFFSEEEVDQIDTGIFDLFESDINKHKKSSTNQPLDPTQVILNYSKGDISLDVLPSSPELYLTEFNLMGESGREFFFRRILSQIIKLGRYDVIVIDCPPNLGCLTLNVLAAHEENLLLIPVKRGRSSRKGIKHLFDTLKILVDRGVAQFKDYRIVFTEFFETQVIDREDSLSIEKQLGDKVLETRISKNNTIDYAIREGIDIFTYDSESTIAKDYMKLAKELLTKMETNNE